MAKLYNLKKLLKKRKKLRNNSTEAEIILWSCIKNKALGIKFRRQYSVGCYILDFYAPECRLGIELDGSIHEEEEQKSYDIEREKRIEAENIKIIRFKNNEIKNNLNSVISKIKNIIISLKTLC